MLKYAGIGSREIPGAMLEFISDLASELRDQKVLCRSGGARGADTAFQKGAGDLFELWRPEQSTPEAFDLAEQFHPVWDNLSLYDKALHARNGHILLGANLDDPVDFVLAWTEGGKVIGGTAQGLRIARAYKIPVFNLGADYADYDSLEIFLKKFLTLPG